MLSYRPTPVQVIKNNEWDNAGVQVLVKREDLNHPFVSGNKWWKLKYNLIEAQKQGFDTILTFGGAFSNHIYASAAAAKEVGLKSIGIIRGDEDSISNPTLQFAKSQDMKLHFVARDTYRLKKENQFLAEIKRLFGDVFIIPEGGTNEFAIRGTKEFGNLLRDEVHFDYICLAGGTGGTAAGLALAMPDKKVTVVSALKGDFLTNEITSLVQNSLSNIEVINNYHFGGYAKYNQELLDFIHYWNNRDLPLEQVYTAKTLFAINDLIKKNYFEKGSSILMIHTGGLQGRITKN